MSFFSWALYVPGEKNLVLYISGYFKAFDCSGKKNILGCSRAFYSFFLKANSWAHML
jgi:hypothetical protein